MGFILFIIATVSTVFFTVVCMPFIWLYHLLSFRWKTGFKKLNKYFYLMALSVDQFGNVSLKTVWHHVMIKKKNRIESKFYLFGDPDDTISYCLAVNKDIKALTKFGLFWANFLDFVDKDHLKKTKQAKKQQEQIVLNKYNFNLEL